MDDEDEPLQKHHILPRHTWAVEHNSDCLTHSHFPGAWNKINKKQACWKKQVKCICRPLDLETDNYVHPLNNDSGDKWTVPLPPLTHYNDDRNKESIARLDHAIKHWERYLDLDEYGDQAGAVLLAQGEVDEIDMRGENHPNYTEGRYCLDNPDHVENNRIDTRERYHRNPQYKINKKLRARERYKNDPEFKESIKKRMREEYQNRYGVDEEYTNRTIKPKQKSQLKNRVKTLERNRKKYAEDLEFKQRRKIQGQKYYLKNRNKIINTGQAYYLKNRDKILENCKKKYKHQKILTEQHKDE